MPQSPHRPPSPLYPLGLLPSPYSTPLPPLDDGADSLARLHNPLIPLIHALFTLQASPSSCSLRPPSQPAQPRPKNRWWSETKTTRGARSWVSPHGFRSFLSSLPFPVRGLTADAEYVRARGSDARGGRDEGRAIEGSGEAGEAEDRGVRVWAGCHTRSGGRRNDEMLGVPSLCFSALMHCIFRKQSPPRHLSDGSGSLPPLSI